MNPIDKKTGNVSESELAKVEGAPSILEGTTWNFQLNFHNGNQSSGQFIFRAKGAAVIQQLKPNPAWWPVSYSENGGRFQMKENGTPGHYALYTGSHYQGKGGGSYTVYPSDPSQDAVFTMTKAN